MSLTYHIKKKTVIYWQLMAMLNLDYCRALVDHHQDCGPGSSMRPRYWDELPTNRYVNHLRCA
jgi:hypothetical protein